MIYSEDINKVCRICVNASPIPDNDEEFYCELYKKNTAANHCDCKKFKYDIFKKTVHRKRRFKTNLTAEDFTL